MLVDKTNFDLVIYNRANFKQTEETSSYWSVKRISVFSLLSDIPATSQCITVTNIENTVRAVHSCNSSFLLQPTLPYDITFTYGVGNDVSYNTCMLRPMVVNLGYM